MGLEVEHEVDGVQEILSNLSQGIGPKPKDIAQYSGFFQLVLKRLEHFYVRDVQREIPPGGQLKLGESRLVTVSGMPAIRALYTEVRAKFEQSECVPMSDLQPLRAYGWLLVKEECKEVTKWIGVVAASLAQSSGLQAIGHSAQTDCAIVSTDAVGAHASASSSSAAPLTKREQAKQAKSADATSNMLRFFSGSKSSAARI